MVFRQSLCNAPPRQAPRSNSTGDQNQQKERNASREADRIEAGEQIAAFDSGAPHLQIRDERVDSIDDVWIAWIASKWPGLQMSRKVLLFEDPILAAVLAAVGSAIGGDDERHALIACRDAAHPGSSLWQPLANRAP